MVTLLPRGLPNPWRMNLKGQLKRFNFYNKEEVHIFHQLAKTFIISVTLKGQAEQSVFQHYLQHSHNTELIHYQTSA